MYMRLLAILMLLGPLSYGCGGLREPVSFHVVRVGPKQEAVFSVNGHTVTQMQYMAEFSVHNESGGPIWFPEVRDGSRAFRYQIQRNGAWLTHSMGGDPDESCRFVKLESGKTHRMRCWFRDFDVPFRFVTAYCTTHPTERSWGHGVHDLTSNILTPKLK